MSRIKYLEAAGLEVKRGRPAVGPSPSKEELIRLYLKEEKAIREVASDIGCTKDMVYRALKKYGIESRPNTKRSILRKQSPKILKDKAHHKSLRATARDLGVNPSTLSRYLRAKIGK